MSDNNQADNRLVCTNCSLPLASIVEQNPSSTSVRCPRCNTSLTVDSACKTSCLSCAKMHKKDPSPCISETVSIDITNNSQEKSCEISGSNVEGNEHGIKESRGSDLLLKTWQKLKSALFHVK